MSIGRRNNRLNNIWQQRTPRSIWIRALIYLLIVSTGWLFVLPVTLVFLEQRSLKVQFRKMPYPFLGAAVFLFGTILGMVSGFYLIAEGQGTPLPLDPPRKLVTIGPYRLVRNPQAIAMTLTVSGEMIAVKSRMICLLLPLTLIYLEILVGPWEEHQLLAAHGEQYLAYKLAVSKWIPGQGRRNGSLRFWCRSCCTSATSSH